MRALPPSKRRFYSQRFSHKGDFPKHLLRNYVCSPQNGTCIPIADVISQFKFEFQKKYSHYSGSDLPDTERVFQSMVWLFHRVYESGYVWYPRDRWRTAWQLSMSATKQLLGRRAESNKHRLYEAVRHLRNPSSDHEAMK